jgi:hypothetical protein
MELFGLMFSLPASFIATVVYAHILNLTVKRSPLVSRLFVIASCVVLSLLVLEFIGVATAGPLHLRRTIGPHFYTLHVVLFFLGVPALANLMQLQKRVLLITKWAITGCVCACLGFSVFLLQFVVSESLYGHDGMSGPYNVEDHMPVE